MQKISIMIILVILFLFISGCTQHSPIKTTHFTNSLEENISKLLLPGTDTKDVWDALANEKVPEEIRYRPPHVWIMAEIDPLNQTWIAIDVEQREIIHEGENKTYFSGIPFKSYDEYQKALDAETYTPLSFSPIRPTPTSVVETPTSTPYKQSYDTNIDINSIFFEALIGFILGFLAILFIGFDAPEVLGGIIVIFGVTSAGLALVNNPSTDLGIVSFNLSNFIGTWVMECLKMSLGAAFGAVIGSFVTAIQNFLK